MSVFENACLKETHACVFPCVLQTVLSDGEHYIQGMLATQLNHLVHSNELTENSLIQVEDFMNNNVQGRTVIILLKIKVISSNPGQRFGKPEDVEKAPMATSAAAAPPAAPMYNRTNNQYSAPPVKPQNTYGNNNNNPAPSNNPYGAAPQNSYGNQQSNQFGGGGGSAPIVRASTTSTGQPITPIAQLNMYQNRWTIRARLTSKSDIRTWSNAKGEGSLFSVDLLDSSGMDIRATFFKEAVDKFYNMLEINKVYTLSGGRLKVANVQWNTCKSSFEITFDQNSEIHLDNDTGDIQEQIYEFVRIADLENVEANKNVDVLAVVKVVSEPAMLISKKSGQELTKCDLTLVDDSATEINLTVWGEQAKRAPTEFEGTPVVAFRRVRVSDYGGKSLSSGSGGVQVNPRIPETARLAQWFQTSGGATAKSLSSSVGGSRKVDSFVDRKTISAITKEHMGYSNPEKPDWIGFKGTINFLKKDKEGGAWYTACANSGEPCKNRFKVTQTTDGNWYCDKCQGTFPNCVRRWIFSGTVTDDTCTTWVSMFNEQAEILFAGATADEVYKRTMDENHDQDAYDSYFARANFSDWVFKCKVKQENVGDETRVKTSVVAMQPLDYAKESLDLLDAIAKF